VWQYRVAGQLLLYRLSAFLGACLIKKQKRRGPLRYESFGFYSGQAWGTKNLGPRISSFRIQDSLLSLRNLDRGRVQDKSSMFE